MPMTETEAVWTIAVAAAGTMLTRFLPFVLLSGKRELPAVVKRLGEILPPALIGMLVIYCLKDANPFAPSHGVPELLAALVAAALQWKWNNVILTIVAATGLYVLLLATLF